MSESDDHIAVFQKRRSTYLRTLLLCAGSLVAGIAAVVMIRNTAGFALGGSLMGLAVLMYYGFAAILLRCPACNAPQITVSFGGFTIGNVAKYSASRSSGASVWLNPHDCIYCQAKLR